MVDMIDHTSVYVFSHAFRVHKTLSCIIVAVYSTFYRAIEDSYIIEVGSGSLLMQRNYLSVMLFPVTACEQYLFCCACIALMLLILYSSTVVTTCAGHVNYNKYYIHCACDKY